LQYGRLQRLMFKSFHDAGIPLITWVHELPTCINRFVGGARTMDIISESSQQVVYVSKFVQEANNQSVWVGSQFWKSYPQRGYAKLEIRYAFSANVRGRTAYLSHSAPDYGLAVCIDRRKGPDLFVKIAHKDHNPSKKEARQVELPHFVWLGSGLENEMCAWCEHDAELLGIAKYVHFVGAPITLQIFTGTVRFSY